MNYDLIKEICRVNKINLQDVASEIGLTITGFKRGIDSGGLGIRYVVPLCKTLCISPNRLFGYIDDRPSNTQTQTGGVGNTQIVEAGISALQEQLREKDRQISKLLDLLNKK